MSLFQQRRSDDQTFYIYTDGKYTSEPKNGEAYWLPHFLVHWYILVMFIFYVYTFRRCSLS